MTLFRRGNVYLCYESLDSAFTYDADTDRVRVLLNPKAALGSDAREWLPVLEDDPIPDRLRSFFVVKFRPKG